MSVFSLWLVGMIPVLAHWRSIVRTPFWSAHYRTEIVPQRLFASYDIPTPYFIRIANGAAFDIEFTQFIRDVYGKDKLTETEGGDEKEEEEFDEFALLDADGLYQPSKNVEPADSWKSEGGGQHRGRGSYRSASKYVPLSLLWLGVYSHIHRCIVWDECFE